MIVDPSVVPGLLFLLAELVALAGVGYVIVRVALRETDYRVALAQGLVVGPAIWGVVVNLVMYALPGMAGAAVGWIFVLALALVLTWRSPKPVRPRLRATVGFALAALALFWVALASRQTLSIPDVWVHIGLAAAIREGGFPPELPTSPGMPVLYHYGVYLLGGLLAPPSGPDLAFVEELLGAYAWISLFLVVVTALWRRASGFAVLVAAPLLLTAGACTFNCPSGIVAQGSVPTGIPAAGLRTSLMDVFWHSLELPISMLHYALPNIERPAFNLSYALAFVVLAQASRAESRSWLSVTTLAALVGFLGLTSSTLTPIVLALYAGLEAVRLIQSTRAGAIQRSEVIRTVCGLMLAALLPLAGGFSTLILGDSVPSGLSLGWNGYFSWTLLGTVERLPGGVGLAGLGPLAAASAALLLARRDRLVQALAVGAGLLLLAYVMLRYEPATYDLNRITGQARNFALFALLIALGVRLADLRTARWRYAAGAALAVLIVWPTVAAPVRNLGMAVGRGIELANARRTQEESNERFVIQPIPSAPIVDYIRGNTAVDARVFSPNAREMTFNTGRPNASGFAGLVHLIPFKGPEYLDVLHHLEPAAVRRIGFDYVHAPDSWVESLPDEAVKRLSDPRLFEVLVRDESESLYRVLPAFVSLDTPPAPASYEALRQAVPASATVFLVRLQDVNPRPLMRTAHALSHTKLLGKIHRSLIHLRTPWEADPLGDHVPDLVIAPAQFLPWLPAASRQPIWWNDETAVYAINGAVDPIMPPRDKPLPFSVRVSDVSEADGRIAFTATFDDRGPDQWTSQDWVLIATRTPPWNLPKQVLPNGSAAIAIWFLSYLNPGNGTTSLAYEFDFLAPSLAVRREYGVLKPLDRSEGVLDLGSYVLAVRLRHEYRPNYWRDAAIIPVLNITVSQTGEVSYHVHEEAGVVKPVP